MTDDERDEPNRLFLCAYCRAQVAICRRHDRGQRYCGPDCRKTARARQMKEAGTRFQRSEPGRAAHAARQRRYRERKQREAVVTHQPAADDAPDPPPARAERSTVRTANAPHNCVVCGRHSAFVRRGVVAERGAHRRSRRKARREPPLPPAGAGSRHRGRRGGAEVNAPDGDLTRW